VSAAGGQAGYDIESYFSLVERGLVDPEDHIELLEGVIVASPPQSPLHSSVILCVDAALRAAIGPRALIRTQMPLVVRPRSAPEPDLAVVRGTPVDYRNEHPASALLVVEVAESSLPQDRLSKSRIYAQAGVIEYWIVNLRDRHLEVHTLPDPERRVYSAIRIFVCGETVELQALPGAVVAVSDLFPGY